jgi:head-tail adaptor
VITLSAGSLNRLVRIEKRGARAGGMSAGQAPWERVAEVRAEVQDMLPSRARGEDLSSGLTISRRPARVRMRWRADITADMRLVMGTRIMKIVSEPAEIGFRSGIEFMVETTSTEGEEA